MALAVVASMAPTPSVTAAAVAADILHDPLAPPEAADVVEEAVDDASLDPETSETAADRLASEDAPYDPVVHTDTFVPEHQEFDAWYAAQSRTPPVATQNQPSLARSSSIPPSRPHKRKASSSDPSKTKRSWPSTSSTTRIPSVPKAGMSSVNNSSAETVR
ncbi:hypothetical protein V6N11_018419 [Hibiscus sabdariffa]|uniref:Uncharacterized protein n=1 Tax=Hibiscus sabdariffa TaxID=183260 RepID=A0ABR2T7A7_9ROSI